MFYNEKIFKRFFRFKGKKWYKNILQIPGYFKAINSLVKTGYDEYATWETYHWFITTVSDVLKDYKENKTGYPELVGDEDDPDFAEKNEMFWDEQIDNMVELLTLMDDTNPYYEDMDPETGENMREISKEKFFELFSKYFYYLWD